MNIELDEFGVPTCVYAVCDARLSDKLMALSRGHLEDLVRAHVEPLYPVYGANGEFHGEYLAIITEDGYHALNRQGAGVAISDTRLFGEAWATVA
tara:strand:+ start:707 stop:991 length:285 start_codon:yes stop_codon:yes gene_type:complete